MTRHAVTKLVRGIVAAAVAVLAAGTACHSAGPFVWVDSAPRAMLEPENSSLIRVGDVIGVRVWNQEANSIERTRVREDGRISVPFLNDIDAAGSTPAELAKRLEVKLKTFIVNPVVTVLVHERPPLRISVVGQVGHPGVYEIQDGSGVIHALAAAGGVTPFADTSGVYVLRAGAPAASGTPGRIRFHYRDLQTARPPASLFRLRPGDVVVVE